jgi:hypothetical protein
MGMTSSDSRQQLINSGGSLNVDNNCSVNNINNHSLQHLAPNVGHGLSHDKYNRNHLVNDIHNNLPVGKDIRDDLVVDMDVLAADSRGVLVYQVDRDGQEFFRNDHNDRNDHTKKKIREFCLGQEIFENQFLLRMFRRPEVQPFL